MERILYDIIKYKIKHFFGPDCAANTWTATTPTNECENEGGDAD